MVSGEIFRRTAYLRRCLFGILPDTVSHAFCFRLDLLPLFILFGDFRCRRRKFQLYLAVKCGKFGLQLFKFILLLPHFARYLLQLRYPLLQYLVHLFVTH